MNLFASNDPEKDRPPVDGVTKDAAQIATEAANRTCVRLLHLRVKFATLREPTCNWEDLQCSVCMGVAWQMFSIPGADKLGLELYTHWQLTHDPTGMFWTASWKRCNPVSDDTIDRFAVEAQRVLEKMVGSNNIVSCQALATTSCFM